jgi:hypothetical protein
LTPKNVSFDKQNKPSFTADAKCTIVETAIKELLARGGTLTEEQRIAVLTLGTHIVQKTVDTINRVLDGEAALINESGMFTNQDELTAFYTKRTDDSLAIGRRVSNPNEQGLRITGSYLTII